MSTTKKLKFRRDLLGDVFEIGDLTKPDRCVLPGKMAEVKKLLHNTSGVFSIVYKSALPGFGEEATIAAFKTIAEEFEALSRSIPDILVEIHGYLWPEEMLDSATDIWRRIKASGTVATMLEATARLEENQATIREANARALVSNLFGTWAPFSFAPDYDVRAILADSIAELDDLKERYGISDGAGGPSPGAGGPPLGAGGVGSPRGLAAQKEREEMQWCHSCISLTMGVLRKILDLGCALRRLKKSPDFDVDRFVNLIDKFTDQLHKNPTVGRCTDAINHIKNSTHMLRNNFEEYHETYEEGGPVNFLQSYVSDIIKLKELKPATVMQFKKLLAYMQTMSEAVPEAAAHSKKFGEIATMLNIADNSTDATASTARRTEAEQDAEIVTVFEDAEFSAEEREAAEQKANETLQEVAQEMQKNGPDELLLLLQNGTLAKAEAEEFEHFVLVGEKTA